MKVLWVASHPVQYQAPLFRALAERCALTVAFAHRQTPAQQARAGYGVEFEWDVDLLEGYRSVFLRPGSRRPSIENFWRCRSPDIAPLVAKEAPDVVVVGGWNLLAYWQALWAARRRGVPVLARTDTRLVPDRSLRLACRRLLRSWVLRCFTGFLAAGTESRRYLERHRVPASRIFTCPHTVDVGRFAGGRAPDRGTARAKLGLSGDVRLVAFVGRLLEWKRPLDVCEAIARLPDPATHHFLCVGAGPLAGAVEQSARTLGVTAHVAGFRNQRELPAWLQAADVMVLPSDSTETWGLVANEALAAGCPVILSDTVGSAPDLGAFMPAVHIYPCGDVNRLASALQQAAAADRASVDRARASAVASFSPARVAEAYLAALAASGAGP